MLNNKPRWCVRLAAEQPKMKSMRAGSTLEIPEALNRISRKEREGVFLERSARLRRLFRVPTRFRNAVRTTPILTAGRNLDHKMPGDSLRACLRSLGYVKLRLLPRQCNHVSFLSQRHQPGAIRPDSSHIGVGPPSDQAPHRGPVRRFLRGPLPPEKRLPMADAPCGLPRLAHLLQVFPAMG